MVKTATKNKMLFYVLSVAIALFLAVGTIPQTHAQGLGDDIIPPDDVENVQIAVYDEAVVLSWDVATDDVGVEGYNIYYGNEPVTAESGEYTELIDAGDVIEYMVAPLENEETYYFAVTAYDAAGNESENYSDEVSGTPDPTYGTAPARFTMHEAADEEPPTVTDAQAPDNETVEVVFSEGVVLPATNPESAFTIIDNATSEPLDIVSAEMDAEDTIGQTVLLKTTTQEPGAEYVLTAGIQIEDTAGNPIVSGTSDTAAFIGSVVEPGEDITDDLPDDDLIPPMVVSAASLDNTTVQVIFSEEIILSSDPENNFFIAEADNALNTLDIVGIELDPSGSMVTITTEPQENIMYSIIVTDVIDENGNEIDETQNTAMFEGGMIPETDEEEEEDMDELPALALSPENVRNLVATIVREIVVSLTWELPDDQSIADLILYKSVDGGDTYDSGTSLGPDREEVELTGLTPGEEYYFKLTTMDAEGNESDGMITSIKLPETGMGLGLLFGASMGLAALRKKKRK